LLIIVNYVLFRSIAYYGGERLLLIIIMHYIIVP
jgi:hypothetical protein